MPEKIVFDPTRDKMHKPKEKEKPVIADEPLHAEEAKGEEPLDGIRGEIEQIRVYPCAKESVGVCCSKPRNL